MCRADESQNECDSQQRLHARVGVSVGATLVAAWRKRKTDERARMTLAYWAWVGIAFVLAAGIVVAVMLVPY